MRDRRIIIGALAWVILAAQSPREAPRDAPQQKQAEAASPSEKAAPEAPPPLQQANEPPGYYNECERGNDQRQSDLCAQWKAADAANKAADLTFWFGIIGSIIGFLTLSAAVAAAWFARKAARHGERGSDAAEEGLAHMRKTSEMELRPYVHMVELVSEVEDSLLLLTDLALRLKNHGSTPAIDLSVKAGWGFRIPNDGKRVFPDIRLNDCAASDELPPGAEVVVDVESEPSGDLLPEREAMRAFCRFEIEYSDKFGNRWGRFETYIYLSSRNRDSGRAFRFYSSP